MASPRIDELKRRIEREPASRLFAQLAEELRKEGDLAESIRVARTGLQAHPNYPSARLTLGRALFETGQLGPARIELEGVLRGAPDNILAARMLGECLEGLGDPAAALLQFRAASRLAPEDRQIEAHLRALEQRLARAGDGGSAAAPAAGAGLAAPPQSSAGSQRPAVAAKPVAASPAPTPGPPVSARATPPPPPVPAAPSPPVPSLVPDPGADFEDVFEPAPAWKRSAGPANVAPDDAIMLLEDEAPTLPGSPFLRPPSAALHPPVTPAVVAPLLPPPVAAEPPLPPPQPSGESTVEGFDTLAGQPAFAPVETVAETPAPSRPPDAAAKPDVRIAADGASTAAFPVAGPLGGPAAPPADGPLPGGPGATEIEAVAAAPMSTPTMAEIYFEQGLYARAAAVYEDVIDREPSNERARARLIEIRALGRALESPSPDDPRTARRQALERTISKLEQMLSAVRRA